MLQSKLTDEPVDDQDTVQEAPVRSFLPESEDEDATLSFPEFEPPPMPPKKGTFGTWLRGFFSGR